MSNIVEIPFDYDEDYQNIATSLALRTYTNNVSLFFEFSISKNIRFFQPFMSIKFIQNFCYNLTELDLVLNLSDLPDNVADLFGNGVMTVTNSTKQNEKGENLGEIIPVTDFIFIGGFEFVMKIFRLGIEGSFGCFSKKGMLTLGMCFQVEQKNFKKYQAKQREKNADQK
jgi:hypothetical protein